MKEDFNFKVGTGHPETQALKDYTDIVNCYVLKNPVLRCKGKDSIVVEKIVRLLFWKIICCPYPME